MHIKLNNLGVLKVAEFHLSDLTIICGKNNTGKTYAVYALYGFLKLWKNFIKIRIEPRHIDELIHKGSTSIDLESINATAPDALKKACEEYSRYLHKVFASRQERFTDAQFQLQFDTIKIDCNESFNRTIRSGKKDIISFQKPLKNFFMEIIWLQEKDQESLPRDLIATIINDVLLDLLFAAILPTPFIASAERTGAAIFRKELDFARNRLLDDLEGMGKNLDPFKLMNRVYDSYPLAVKDNVDFTRNFQDIVKNDSFLVKNHPELLNEFNDIIGGEYQVKSDELYFLSKKNRTKLTMDESSSAVRSLLAIGLYLKHIAQPGEILLVDEPELNLHPENQRRIARLFARLANIKIRIFLTTHSDYIVKELNTLIMLNHLPPSAQSAIMEQYKDQYHKTEMLSVDQVRVYNACTEKILLPGKTRKTAVSTFSPADISPTLGIEVKDFDDNIIQMTKIQEEILMMGEDSE